MEEKVIQNHKIKVDYGFQLFLIPFIIRFSNGGQFAGKILAVIVANAELPAGLSAKRLGKISFSTVRSAKDADVHTVSDEIQRGKCLNDILWLILTFL
jgi:hypothetical protein